MCVDINCYREIGYGPSSLKIRAKARDDIDKINSTLIEKKPRIMM